MDVILEESNRHHPRFPACNMFVPWSTIYNWISGRIYLAISQAALLFGADTLVVIP